MNKASIIFLVFISFTCSGQLIQSDRFEILLEQNDHSYYEISSLNESGLMLHRRILGINQDQMEFIRLDTTFKELWKGYLTYEKSMLLVGSEVRENHLVLLFKDYSKGIASFLISVIQTENGSFGNFEVTTPFAFTASVFKVSGNSALIGGYYNSRPIVLHFDLNTRKSKIIPGFFNDPGEIIQLLPHSDGSFEVLSTTKNIYRKKSIWIRYYSETGDLLNTITINPEDNYNLISGLSFRQTDGTQIVSGVYGKNKEYSRGIFISKIQESGDYGTSYYSFTELSRFFNYMKERKEARIKDRIARREVRGKKVRLSYKLLVHDLILDNDQYILIGEAYYPHYSTYGGDRFSFNTMSGSRVIFDGYQYTHAVVIGISKEGKLLWDNSFEINDVRTFDLQQFVNIKPSEDKIFLFYIQNNIIRTKIIQNQNIIEGKAYEAIKLKYENDQFIRQISALNKLAHWYGDFFYAYGVQQVRNMVDVDVGIDRKVFFINKISYK